MKTGRKGQGLMEYGLILVLISLMGVMVLRQLNAERERLYDRSTTAIETVVAHQ